MGCLTLCRVLADHIQFLGHLVAVVALEIVVKGLVVAGNGTPDACCMGCEKGRYSGTMLLQVEESKSCLPLIEMGNEILTAFDL